MEDSVHASGLHHAILSRRGGDEPHESVETENGDG